MSEEYELYIEQRIAALEWSVVLILSGLPPQLAGPTLAVQDDEIKAKVVSQRSGVSAFAHPMGGGLISYDQHGRPAEISNASLLATISSLNEHGADILLAKIGPQK